jgi:hypothetical protein
LSKREGKDIGGGEQRRWSRHEERKGDGHNDQISEKKSYKKEDVVKSLPY